MAGQLPVGDGAPWFVRNRPRTVSAAPTPMYSKAYLPTRSCPGTNGVAQVRAVGPEVTTLNPGDRITGDPFITCGHCAMCRAQRRNLCLNRRRRVAPPASLPTLPSGIASGRPPDPRRTGAERTLTSLAAVNLSSIARPHFRREALHAPGRWAPWCW